MPHLVILLPLVDHLHHADGLGAQEGHGHHRLLCNMQAPITKQRRYRGSGIRVQWPKKPMHCWLAPLCCGPHKATDCSQQRSKRIFPGHAQGSKVLEMRYGGSALHRIRCFEACNDIESVLRLTTPLPLTRTYSTYFHIQQDDLRSPACMRTRTSSGSLSSHRVCGMKP